MDNIKFWVSALVIVLATSLAYGGKKSEADYQHEWCTGKVEVMLSDRTRVDCLTDTHAIEIDFASKWKQAIGQSLHYALMARKKAGIALILREPSDQRYLDQLNAVIKQYQLPIAVWGVR
jgi:hypothetical protein